MSPRSTACRAPFRRRWSRRPSERTKKKRGKQRPKNGQRIRRVEKDKVTAQRELARAQAKQKREQEQADKEAERKRKERKKAFEAIAKLPVLAHEARLAELAKRSGEDLDFLRDEFAAYYVPADMDTKPIERSEEHTSELQSLRHLVCRLLLEKKKKKQKETKNYTNIVL